MNNVMNYYSAQLGQKFYKGEQDSQIWIIFFTITVQLDIFYTPNFFTRAFASS